MTLESDNQYLLNIYKRIPLEIKKAKGMYIYSREGKYLDLFSGIATVSLGHRNKKINCAIRKQIKKYLHVSNYFVSEKSVKLAKLLIESSFASKVLFTNSGTEANEAALKLVRLYGNKTNKTKVLALKDSFHGRTFGSMSITGQECKTLKFSPLLENIKFIERNNLEDLRKNIDKETSAIFLELIQGEGGINLITKEYINELVRLKEKYNFLIIIDEIQTGLLRTGLIYSYLHYKFTPDVVTLAKSLGGGLPLGAVLIGKKVEDVIKYGDHGSTFAPNPVACASGYRFFKEVSKFKHYHHVNLISNYFFLELNKLKKKYPEIIKDVRGIGLMIGIEIAKDVETISDQLFKSNILINITNKNIIRLLPAFIIKKKHVDIFIRKLNEILENLEVKDV